jgi:nickel transport protein
VSDGMGHRLEVVVPVARASPGKGIKIKEHKQEASLSKYEKAAMGLSIIFGISGYLLWWGSRKRDRERPEKG